MNTFSRFSDSFLSKFVLFFIGIIVGGYYCDSTPSALLFAVVFSVCASEIYLNLLYSSPGVTPSKFTVSALNKLRFTPVCDTTNALALGLKRFSPTLEQNKIVVNNTVIHLAFFPQKLGANDIYSLVGASMYDKHLILASEITPDASDFCKNWGSRITLLCSDDAVEFLSKANALPAVTVLSKKEKRAKIMGEVISKKRVKAYFSCAVTVLFLSLFSARSIYFIIFSSLAFSLGIISLFARRKT